MLLTFRTTDDLKILCNDWPYGVEKGIVHLVIWTKFELEEDPATGDLTDAMRKEIDDFVKKTFCSRMPSDQVSILLYEPSRKDRGRVLMRVTGHLVQELEIAQVDPCDRALSCHAQQSRHGVYPGSYEWRCSSD
jgi:hypothetical protein